MKLQAKVLAGQTESLMTKKGEPVQKTRLKVQDVGAEVTDLLAYWVDFFGEYALTQEQIESLLHQEVEIEIRRVAVAEKDGKAVVTKTGRGLLNLSGGRLLHQGHVVQQLSR